MFSARTASATCPWYHTAGYRANATSGWVWRVWTASSGRYLNYHMAYKNWYGTEPGGSREQCMFPYRSWNYRWGGWSCGDRECVVCEVLVWVQKEPHKETNWTKPKWNKTKRTWTYFKKAAACSFHFFRFVLFYFCRFEHTL